MQTIPEKQEKGGTRYDRTEGRKGLDFECLRLGIERCDPDLVLGFYAEDARISIVDARATRSSYPFELRGKAEIAKHLRTVYGQKAFHRVEGEAAVGEDRVWVETTLEVREGKIVRQTDSVAVDARVDTTLPDRLLSSQQATEKEDFR